MKRMTTALVLATCCTALMGCMPETATGMQHQALPSTAPYLSLIIPKCAKDKTKNLEILKEAEKRIEPYIKPVGQHLTLSIESGKEINISEDLYHYFARKIKNHNRRSSPNKFPRVRKNISETASDY